MKFTIVKIDNVTMIEIMNDQDDPTIVSNTEDTYQLSAKAQRLVDRLIKQIEKDLN